MKVSDFAQMNTQITQPDSSEPTRINYRLRKENGEWKVYEVTVEDISIMANYRNQFNRVINNQGVDVLMNEMQNKQRQLRASLTSKTVPECAAGSVTDRAQKGG
jgi:ABC-type transporter MlaC component